MGSVGTRAGDLRKLISPESIAVIGASPDPAKFGNRALRFLAKFGFGGVIYPVSPGHGEIGGRTCFPDVRALPEPPDLAIVAVPSALVEEVVRDCAASGIGAVVIYSSGFAETGPQGAAAQLRLAGIAGDAGMVLAGPNCQGIADFYSGAVSNFSTGLEIDEWRPGPLALVGQSGNVGGFIFKTLQAKGIGVGYLAATGNEAGVDASQVAEYLVGRPGVGAVLMCLDGLRAGPTFVAAARSAHERGIPLCVMKMGRFEAGRRAATSHTAALPVDDEVFDAVCRRYGVLRLQELHEVIDVGFALGAGMPLPAGDGVGIASSSGGLAVMLADGAAGVGLNVVDLDEETIRVLDEVLPMFLGRANPVDTATVTYNDIERYPRLLRALLADPGVHQLQVGLGLQMWQVEGAYRALREVASTSPKPVIVTWCGGEESVPGRLANDGVAVFDDPARSLRLGRLLRDLRLRRESAAARPARAPRGAQPLDRWRLGWNPEQAAALGAMGIKVPTTTAVDSGPAAVAAARRCGYPVALKRIAVDGGHKSERGAVRLGVESEDGVVTAYNSLAAAASAGDIIVVQAMVDAGAELFVGIKRDPEFGPVVLVGSGGFYVERWRDARALVPPLARADVLAAVMSLAIAPALLPHRDRSGSDLGALADMVLALEDLFEEMPMEVAVLEVNPVIVLPQGSGAWAVDWRCEIGGEPTR